MTMKNFKETKLSHLTKGLINNYHYGLNTEHAKPVLEEYMLVNSLLGDIPTLNKQREVKGVLQTSLYMYPSQI